MKTNCPNCGAPLQVGEVKCPYCGTIYYDLSAIDFDSGKPIYLTIKQNGHLITQKVQPQTVSFEFYHETVSAYGGKNNTKLLTFPTHTTLETNINFIAIADDNNQLCTIKI